MASIFKTSCFVFWIIWMSTLSFLLAMGHIQRLYSYVDMGENLGLMVISACLLTVTMAVLGCCCIKCDIMHICCAFWYLGFTLFGIVTVSLLVMTAARSSSSGLNISREELLMKVIKMYNTEGLKVPGYLRNAELEFKCCGIIGFKDYRAFILEAGHTGPDVPATCCKNVAFDKNLLVCKPSSSFNQDKDLTHGVVIPGTTTVPIPLSNSNAETLVKELYGDSSLGSVPDRYTHPSLKLPANISKSVNIYLKGCYEQLRKKSEELNNVYFNFCFFLMICAAVMSILFIQNCLRARKERRDKVKELLELKVEESPKLSVMETSLESPSQQAILQELQKKGAGAGDKEGNYPRRTSGGVPLPLPTVGNRRV